MRRLPKCYTIHPNIVLLIEALAAKEHRSDSSVVEALVAIGLAAVAKGEPLMAEAAKLVGDDEEVKP